jgi:hypothetical protein
MAPNCGKASPGRGDSAAAVGHAWFFAIGAPIAKDSRLVSGRRDRDFGPGASGPGAFGLMRSRALVVLKPSDYLSDGRPLHACSLGRRRMSWADAQPARRDAGRVGAPNDIAAE